MRCLSEPILPLALAFNGGSAEGNNSGGGNMVVNTSDNRVTIASGATVNGSVFGGYATGQTLGPGTIGRYSQ